MKKFVSSILVAVSAMSMIVSDAGAKRLGSGSSSGRQSHNVSRQAPAQQSSQSQPTKSVNNAQPAPTPAPAAPAVTPPAAPLKPTSPWKGMLGGALAGLGIAALMSHLGIGGELGSIVGSILMIALLVLAVMFIVKLLRRNNVRRDDGTLAYSGGGNNHASDNITPLDARKEAIAQPSALQASAFATSGDTPWGVPADFDETGFLSSAKTYFLRLQASWDKADLRDLSEFTTTEMFVELKTQLEERGPGLNHTDVVSLNAELMGVETLATDHLASVKFTGTIKESENGPATSFVEVWNLSKPANEQGGWMLSGIQQFA